MEPPPKRADARTRTPAGGVPHPREHNAPELKVSGRNACRALYDKRPDDIRRVYVTEENIPFFADTLKFCARQRIAYHVKTAADLDVVAETMHHDGVLFLARAKGQRAVADVLEDAERARAQRAAATFVLLEDVKNPHNLGAILRVCAHFGVRAVLAAGQTPALSPAVMRTAEGGAEHVDVVPVGDGHEVLTALRALGFSVIATSSHTAQTLGVGHLPERAVVLFGSEGDGLSRALMERADVRVAIPGSGALESLNVACASSVVLWELWRHHAMRPPPPPAPSARTAQSGAHKAGAAAAPPRSRSRSRAR